MMIDWIDFGKVSAERDENLSEYFFENGVLQEVVKNRFNFLVLGRKGAGKTAVFQHLSENPEKYLAIDDRLESLSLQDYSWDIHSLLAADGKASSIAYIQSWKYIIYLLAVSKLAESSKATKNLKLASKIIKRVYGSPAPSLGELVGQKIFQLTRLKFPSGSLGLDDATLENISLEGGEISFSEMKSDPKLQSSLNQSIERLTAIFEAALLDYLSVDMRFFVAFDRIDEAWDATSYEESQLIISGLIGACEYINLKFKGSLRPIVFLREDIFETIDLNDKNKLKTDCGELLAWSKSGLIRLILERVNFFARVSSQAEVSKVDELFDRDQMRQQRAPFDHIMLRTMVRPRDFIRFLNLVKQDMLERRDNVFEEEEVNSDRLECQAVYNVEAKYSEWLVDELKDEWRAQFPAIVQLFEAIQSTGATNFTAEDLRSSLLKIGVDCSDVEIKSHLRFLYDNSIIGFRVGKSNQWKFRCFFSSQGFIESDVYKVHDGIHRGLNLTETRASPQSA
ncbi:P-loop ATPase, Sll1717 family [Roseovarius sp. D0-M9]|uniref:P-loop ATPase, Sll1717 family n=1 Tax=Roseovarius sp. D0-M9 TaxID=3127117 RepID=UPI00300FA146